MRTFALALLLLIMSLSVIAAFLSTQYPYTFAATFTMYGKHVANVGVTLTGLFHETKTSSELVFWTIYTDMSVQYPIRLIFYCKNGVLATSPGNLTKVDGAYVDTGYSFCTQVPFQEGQVITVKGTAIRPSQWVPWLSYPSMDFYADLYVIWIL